MSEASAMMRLDRGYLTLLALCDLLETIADQLPHNIDRQECLLLSRGLGAMLIRIQDYEEEVLFPILLASTGLVLDMDDTVDRLKIEHQLDRCYAEDIQDMLHGYGEGHRTMAPDAAGFMLRGFFEAMRRHVAFERQLLLPLARRG